LNKKKDRQGARKAESKKDGKKEKKKEIVPAYCRSEVQYCGVIVQPVIEKK
jgi:hypothetical protein